MESLKQIAERQQAGRTDYYDDPQKDRMLALVLELGEEICVLRSRLETALLLSGEGQTVTQSALDGFAADAALQDERLRQYTEFFEQLMTRLADSGKTRDDD